MADQQRVIAVIRHAKAEQDGPSDFERELASRGRQDAAALGAWLAGEGLSPDHALVSAATRTQQTWAEIASGAGWSLTPDVDRGLYSAGPETVLDIIRASPESARSLVVIGHNPTVAYLAQLLDDGDGDLEATNQMTMGHPTGAATLFSYVGEWADLAEGGATVTGFHVGRA